MNLKQRAEIHIHMAPALAAMLIASTQHGYCLTVESTLQKGYAAIDNKNYAPAERFFKEALEQYETADRNDPGIPIALRGLATVYLRQKRFAEAEAVLLRGLKIQQQYGQSYPGCLFDLYTLGLIRMEQGRLKESKSFLERAVAVEPVPDGRKIHNEAIMLLAKVYGNLGEYKNQERTLRRVMNLKKVRESSWLPVTTWSDLLRCLANQNKWVEFDKEITDFKVRFNANKHQFDRNALLSQIEQLGTMCNEKKHPVEAEQFLKWGIAIAKE